MSDRPNDSVGQRNRQFRTIKEMIPVAFGPAPQTDALTETVDKFVMVLTPAEREEIEARGIELRKAIFG